MEVLPCVEVEPFAGTAIRSVIWLHGLGADGHDFEPIVPELQLDDSLPVRLVFPHAPAIPVTINGGMVMPAWYDISALDLGRSQDVEGIRRSAEYVHALIERENQRGIPTRDIVLAGFSQGGAVAGHVALRYPERFRGLLMLSTYLLLEETVEAERHASNADLPAFLGHGSLDPMVPIRGGLAARELLEGLGHEVEWHDYAIQHHVCLEEIRDVGAWLRRLMADD